MEEMTQLEIALTFGCILLALLVWYLFSSRNNLDATSSETIHKLSEENKILRQNREKEISTALTQQKTVLLQEKEAALKNQSLEFEKKLHASAQNNSQLLANFEKEKRTLFTRFEKEKKEALAAQKNKYESEVAILKNQANTAHGKENFISPQNCANCKIQFKRQLNEALKLQKEEIEAQNSSYVSDLKNQISDLEKREKNLQEENLHLRQHASPSPLPFEWDHSVQNLYRIGAQKGRLQTALSENIDLRFITEITTEGFPFPNAHVEIEPDSLKEKKNYQTFLSHCTCKDFEFNLKRKAACKHMFALALTLNLISITGDPKSSIQKP